MTASALQLNLISQGIFMSDAGTYATKLGNPRFRFTYAGEVCSFYTLQQVKTWIKYNLD